MQNHSVERPESAGYLCNPCRAFCCAKIVMSPFLQNRNVPLIRLPKGGQIGADRDEPGGVAESRSAGASAQPPTRSKRRGSHNAGELSAGQAVVEALSRGRRCGHKASQRGTKVQPRLSAEVSATGTGLGTEKVRWGGGRAFRADAGSRAPERRRQPRGECRDAAALDAASRTMESGTEATEAPATPRTQGAFWRTGANGWQLSPLAGGARTRRVFDRHGRRCHE